MLKLRFSNRYEVLSEHLLAELATAPDDPFAPEQIIVPSAAIRRRIEMDYAERFQVCANVHFDYLAQWIWRQIGLVVDVPEVSPFAAERLIWRILNAFDDADWVSGHVRLASYLGQADAVMRYAFAGRVSRQYERYIAYRPDWLEQWASHQSIFDDGYELASRLDEAWQAELWRRLLGELAIGSEHPSVSFLRTVDAWRTQDAQWPADLRPASIFVPPTMPPLYLDILAGLADSVDLSLFILSPCREFWHDLIDAPRLARLQLEGRRDYHEVGNRLLAGWGRQTQAFLTLLSERTDARSLELEDYVRPERASLLAALQDEILTLERGRSGPIPDADRSVEIHVCHSLVRQLEVLHDQLLDALSAEHGLKPDDVLVVMPGLGQAAQQIHAVFGTVPEQRYIPYTITGLPRSEVNPVAATLLDLLALLQSRFAVSALFDLLRRSSVSRRFGLDEEGLERIRSWIVEAGIHWGLDGSHREALGLPSTDRHSVQQGLDRLFLGFAVPALTLPLGGRLPAGDIEGAATSDLAILDEYVDCLQRAYREAGTPGVAEVWRRRLNEWISDFIAVDHATAQAIHELREAIAVLCDDLSDAAPDQSLSLDVVATALSERLADPISGGLPSGSVTFAGMTPLRNLPYRMICVLGFDDGLFPGVRRPDEFDLIAVAPRLGDRQQGVDDRNVFLDLVLAARERLYVSYTGFSVRDNSALNPSILLSELVDYLVGLLVGDSPSAPEIEAAHRRLFVHHPLQAFSRSYFCVEDRDDPRLFSYAAERVPSATESAEASADSEARNTLAASSAVSDDGEPVALSQRAPFFSGRLAWPEEAVREFTLADLKRFFRNPCRFLLERRVALTLRQPEQELRDDEPFVEEFGQRALLAARLLPSIREGASEEEILRLAECGSEYPAGAFGSAQLRQEIGLIIRFGNAVAALTLEPALPTVVARQAFSIQDESWFLSGTLQDPRSSGLVRWRYDDVRARDYLDGWLDHLLLCALAPRGVALETVWQSRNGQFRLRPCAEARERLAELVALVRDGLAEPARFFPKSAWAYVERLPKGRDEALRAAGKCWVSDPYTYGESEDTWFRLALRGIDDVLDTDFESAACTVFAPLREHLVIEPSV